MKRDAHRYPPRGGGLLSNEQKARICILAREAYALQFTDWEFPEWRHAEQEKACGKASLCDCTQADFLRLKSHFLRLSGEEGEARRVETRAATEPRRIARYKLMQALAERGLAPGYAEAICRRQYHCGLDDASEKQLWRLVFTVRSRRAARRAA